MALSWRKKDGDSDLNTETGALSWRRRDGFDYNIRPEITQKVLTLEISIGKNASWLIVGPKGANIKRLQNFEGVIDINLKEWQEKVIVRAYSNLALNSVEKDVSSLLAKLKIVTIMLKAMKKNPENIAGLRIIDNRDHTCAKEYIFKNSPDYVFEVLRFCTLFGVDPMSIEEDMSISVSDIETDNLPKILEFIENWNTNIGLLDNEIIWNRKRHLIHSNFVQRILVTATFMRLWGSYYMKLNRLRCFSGIDYVELDFDEEDIILQLVIGARSKIELDSCVSQAHIYLSGYVDSLKVHRFCRQADKAQDCGYFSSIPYACASHKLCNKSKFSGMSYLESVFSDPEVVLVELNEIEHTLTLGCFAQEKLDSLLFEVRGKMSFYKAFAWRKNYHGNFKCFIKASDDQMKMDATFGDVCKDGRTLLTADFIDVVDDSSCLKHIKLLESTGQFQGLQQDIVSKSSYALFSESEILSGFCRFLKFVDLPILHNIKVCTSFGVTLYKMKSNWTKPQIFPVGQLLNRWENTFQGHFSFDLKPFLKEAFLNCLVAEGFMIICHQYFTDVFFSDLGNNFRLTARIQNTEISSASNTFDVKYCKTDHVDIRVIDINSSKCSTQIKVSSQKTCDNTFAKEFVQKAVESEELMKENVMSMSTRYSMYNVSIVNRTVFECGDFIIHLDSVSKKSNQRYGKFSDTVQMTLHCPLLNDAISELQMNSGDELLKASTEELFKKFMYFGEHFSRVIDEHL